MLKIKISHALIKSTLILVFVCNYISINAQNEIKSSRDSIQSNNNSYLVTFECKPCTAKNKFSVTGKENFTLKKVEFPLEIKLKQGTYKMTYWQNKIQQIHLPFTVKPDSPNRIIVKNNI